MGLNQNTSQSGRYGYIRYNDFTGGENRKLLPEYLAPNQVVLARNCVISDEGFLVTRDALDDIMDFSLGSGPIISIHPWSKEDGTLHITVQHGTGLYDTTWDGVSLIESFRLVKSGLNSDDLRSVVWKDNLILSNGIDNPFRFDGTSCTDLGGSAPKFKIFTVYGSSLWVVPVSAPSGVQFSELEDFDVWPGLNFILVRSGDGDVITALAPITDQGLMIMKKFSCFPLVGTTYDDISLATAPVSEIGCTSFKSISGNYMLSDSNICMFSLGQVVEVSNTHNSVIGQLSFITKNATFSACDSVNRRRIFHVNDGNIFVVHEKYGNAITSWSGLNASCMAEVQSRTIANIILVGDATSGKIKIFNPNISAAYIPNTFIKTRYDDMNEIQEKVWRAILPEIEVTDGENYSINISYDIDYQNVEGETSFLGSIDNIAVFGEDYWGQAYYSNSIGKTRLKNDFQLHTAKGGRLSIELSTQNRIKFLGMTQKFRLIGRK